MALSFRRRWSALARAATCSSVRLADGGVIDRIETEGAGQVFGEAGVGGVGLDEFEGDGLADRRMCGRGRTVVFGRILGGHDLSLSLPEVIAGPMPASSPSGAVFWAGQGRPRKPLRTAVVRERSDTVPSEPEALRPP